MNYRKFFGIGFLLIAQIVYAQFGQSDLVTIKLSQATWKVDAGTQFKVVLNASTQESWHINSNKPNDDFLIASKVTAKSEAVTLTSINYPQPKELKFEFSEKPVSVYSGDIKIELTFNVNKNTASGKYTVPLKLSYQACNDQICLPPTSISENLQIEVVGGKVSANDETVNVNGKKQDSQVEKSKVKDETGIPKTEAVSEKKDDSSFGSTLEKSGLFLSLIFVFIGGLALNLTPCVYPLIPITIGYFGGESEGRTSRLFLLGILYVLGMSLTYSVIGVVTSLSGAIFGALMQNMFVIIGIALLFVLLALSQFGVYEFKLPDSWVMKAGGAKGGAFGAFFMGLTMGIVAAPCIGPFVLSLVTVVATKGDPYYGFIMFFVLALGLGFPYLLLALFSGKIKSLPRAGMWMDAVKHIFGFVMIAMALYYTGPLIPKSINQYLLPVFGILVAIFLLFFDKTANVNKGFKTFKTVFSVLIITVAVYALWPVEGKSLSWQKFDENEFAVAKSNNEKIIIDFFADWCIPCLELDARTFSNDKVIAEGKDFKTFKVDLTQTGSEATEKLRQQFNVVGVPTVLIFDAKGNEVERITGFVNAETFLGFMEKAK